MPITEKTLSRLSSQRENPAHECSSFALWSPEWIEGGEAKQSSPEAQGILFKHFESRVGEMKPSIIFLGLNRGEGKSKQNKDSSGIGNENNHDLRFHNFHTRGHAGDTKLQRLVAEVHGFAGAYMSDFDYLTSDNNAHAVISKIRTDDKHREDLWNVFQQQLRILDQPRYKIICLKPEMYRLLESHPPTGTTVSKSSIVGKVKYFRIDLDGRGCTFFNCWHHSAAKKRDEKIEQLQSVSSLRL